MNKIFRSLSEPGLLAAVEGNFAEEMACFGRSLPGGLLHQDEELTWFLTGPAGPNGILLTNFIQDEQDYIDNRIDETLNFFRTHQVREIGWRIGPTSNPPDLANYLEVHALSHKATTTCMIMQMTENYMSTFQTKNIEVREALTDDELHIKCAIEQVGFGASEHMAQDYYQTYTQSGFGPDTCWHHYIGWQDGQAVAVAAVLLHQGVAGIYGITTLPEKRRQGIATALMQHILRETTRLGYALVTLSSTEMSHTLYRRFGFQDYCQLHHYKLAFAPVDA
jgi:GNAT superfamily N-acetyltransferase